MKKKTEKEELLGLEASTPTPEAVSLATLQIFIQRKQKSSLHSNQKTTQETKLNPHDTFLKNGLMNSIKYLFKVLLELNK